MLTCGSGRLGCYGRHNPRNRLRRRLSLLTVLVLLLTLAGPAYAEEDTAGKKLQDWFEYGKDPGEESGSVGQEPSYTEQRKVFQNAGLIDAESGTYTLSPEDVVSELPASSLEDGVLNWDESVPYIEWTVDVAQAGLYEIWLDYRPLPGSDAAIERSVRINGEYQYVECRNIPFYRRFTDEAPPKLNNLGDQVKPRQKELFAWESVPFRDKMGYYSVPLTFAFNQGENRIRLEMLYEPMQLRQVTIRPPAQIPVYSQVLAGYMSAHYACAKQSAKFQAEDHVLHRSNPTLRMESNADPLAQPVSVTSRVFNVMGDYWWRSGGQSITWEFTVPETGLYKLCLRDQQIWNDGLPSFRTIAIDGQVPFQELLEYKFSYGKEWRSEALEDDEGNPYLFYLEAGMTHTITMTVTVGPFTEIIQSINQDMLTLSETIRKITMIIGSNPDLNYDYELFKTIPGLSETLYALECSMTEKYEFFNAISTKSSSMANNFRQIARQIHEMGLDPFSIPRRIGDLQNAQTSLGSYYMTLSELPLGIDYFVFMPPDEPVKDYRSNFFQRLWATVQTFFQSFVRDYDNVGSVHGAGLDGQELETITVWMARGNEWAEQLIELSDEFFTPETGIRIKLNVVPAATLNTGTASVLMFALASGNQPDAVLGISYGSPTELAIRGAVADISQYDDFDEVSERFMEKMFIPLTFREGIYALPETMNFKMLFYRKDILQELNLKLPETWSELYKQVFPVLYQNGMQFNYTFDYSPFLFQRGGAYYNEDGTRSGLDTPEAYAAFKELCELYTNYGVPVAPNFLTRFRTGEMPMGIADYSMYIQLAVAAPELLGRWGVAQIPGTERNGVVDHSFGSAGAEACMIFSASEKQDAAWEFLKWWTSTETQINFNKNLEASQGIAARFNTANIEAFKQFNWDKTDLAEFEKSLAWATEMPVVLGGYFTGRQITNAWNRVVTRDISMGGDQTDTNVRDSLELAVEDINRELQAQQAQYVFANPGK